MVNNALLILAGGIGKRFGESKPKQFQIINGKTVLETTLNNALSSFNFEKIVIITNKLFLEETKKIINNFDIIPGGEEWIDSVYEGFKHVEARSYIILEAARPFFSKTNLKEMALKRKNAISIKRPIDAIYKNNESFDRKEFFFATTPQSYSKDFLQEHLGSTRVDDLAKLLIEGNYTYDKYLETSANIKLTYKEDLLFFRKLNQVWND